jgi:hypothetical protein
VERMFKVHNPCIRTRVVEKIAIELSVYLSNSVPTSVRFALQGAPRFDARALALGGHGPPAQPVAGAAAGACARSPDQDRAVREVMTCNHVVSAFGVCYVLVNSRTYNKRGGEGR